jgi:hypothetical protein
VNWSKIAVVSAAVLAAGLLGAWLGGSDRGGTALAGGGGNDKMIVVTTDAQGMEGNRLVLVNTTKQKILVYKFAGNDMGLVVVRGYEFDQELQYTRPGTPGNGFDFETIKRLVEEDRKAKAAAGIQ